MGELLGKCSYGPEMQAGQQVQSHDEMVDREICQLRDEVPIVLTEDPLKWWQENETRYPHVRNLAHRVLAAPLTSVPSEQIFSKAGLVVCKKRAALKPAVVDALLFLNKKKM